MDEEAFEGGIQVEWQKGSLCVKRKQQKKQNSTDTLQATVTWAEIGARRRVIKKRLIKPAFLKLL
mgnify:CR=1 FL=1